jgi:hypothetical protein
MTKSLWMLMSERSSALKENHAIKRGGPIIDLFRLASCWLFGDRAREGSRAGASWGKTKLDGTKLTFMESRWA